MAFNGHTIIDGDGHVIEDCQGYHRIHAAGVSRQVRYPPFL